MKLLFRIVILRIKAKIFYFIPIQFLIIIIPLHITRNDNYTYELQRQLLQKINTVK